ncbi:MAG: hypothetical protein KF734_01150 [Saprospiraceae bacterium]|nr:hypothetical protein [Saprospiraceae bacterium]
MLSILLGQPFFCQAQRLGEFLTNMVAPLDKAKINSNFLWDKGLNGLAEPAIFDGVFRDSVCLQPATFGFLYVQARNAYVGTGTNPLPHPDVYMNYVKRYTGTDTVPFAALALRYHRIHKVDSNGLVSLGFRSCSEGLLIIPSEFQSARIVISVDWEQNRLEVVDSAANNYLMINRLDTEANIISGQFQVTLIDTLTGKKAEITDGGFDIKHSIYSDIR